MHQKSIEDKILKPQTTGDYRLQDATGQKPETLWHCLPSHMYVIIICKHETQHTHTHTHTWTKFNEIQVKPQLQQSPLPEAQSLRQRSCILQVQHDGLINAWPKTIRVSNTLSACQASQGVFQKESTLVKHACFSDFFSLAPRVYRGTISDLKVLIHVWDHLSSNM